MRYRLRTLLIVLAILPPLIWGGEKLFWLVFPMPGFDLCGRRPTLHVPVPVEIGEIDPATEGPGLISVPAEEGESVSEDTLLQHLPSP